MLKLLILGGTWESRNLACRLAEENQIKLVTALAGKTSRPAALPGELHSGGFGGSDGMLAYIVGEGIDLMIDATHPFAQAISHTAHIVCTQLQLPLLRLQRPAWERADGDNWIEVDNLDEAAACLPGDGGRVLLACGRKNIESFSCCEKHFFLLRLIEAPAMRLPLCNYELIMARGPFCKRDEIALLQRHRIDVMVSKNSGGPAAYGKIAAARELGLPVVMLRRPPVLAGDIVSDVNGALCWLNKKLRR